MDFLDNLVLPQSSEHIQLLHYMQTIVAALFIPFIGIVFGGTALSLYYKRKGIAQSNNMYLRYAKDLIETVTINKSVGVILGIVPVLTSMIIFAQLLHNSGTGVTGYLALSLLFISVGLIMVYAYRYSLVFTEIFNSFKEYHPNDALAEEDFIKFRKGNQKVNTKSGAWSLVFLFFGIWLFSAANTIALYPNQWGNERMMYEFFGWETLSRLVQFILTAFTLTGAAVLFGFFYWDGGRKIEDKIYTDFVRKTSVTVAFTAALLQPLFLLINIIAMPADGLTGSVFTYSIIGLALLFLGYHFLYDMIKNVTPRYSGALFFVFLFAIISLVIKDQLAMSNATRVQAAALNAGYEAYIAEMRGAHGGVEEISGQEIFEVRCASCHRFDTKLVGPAYQDVLPKYEGKIQDLTGFILNPVKVDPAYPPMPNPGLKPNEAKAVAEYIMETYKQQ